MNKILNLTLGLSLIPTFAISSVDAQELFDGAEGSSAIEEVLVSASLIPIATERSANAITIIDQETIQNRAVLSVSDLLRDVAGLAVSRSGVVGSATQIRARGTEANHLLVFIDGVEAGDASQDDGVNWGTLTTNDIERIEVIKGPQSALHGSDAVAGVVNVITRRAEKPLSATVYSDTGSYATLRNGFSVGHRQDNVDVRFAVNRLETNGDNISRSGDEKDGYENTTYSLSAGIQVNKQLDINVSARRSEGFNEYDDDADGDGFVEDQDRMSEFNNQTRGLRANYISADGEWQHQLKLSRSSNDNQAFADTVAGNITSSTKDQYQFVGSKLWDGSSQRLSVLIESEQEDFSQRGPLTSWGADPNQDRERNTDSVGLEYRADLTSQFTFALSARHDDNSEFDNATTHKFEASYQMEIGRLRGAYGTAIKNPTFSERFGTYTNFIGNPDLKPEESESWEIGLDHRLTKSDMALSITLFNARLENEIDGFVWNGSGFTAANKAGKSKREGVELTASGTVAGVIDLNASYTYTDSVESDDNLKYVAEIRRPRHIGSLNLAWNAMEKLHINTNIQFNGSQTDKFYPPVPPYEEKVTIDSYTLLNVSANYSVSQNLDMYLQLDNLLEEDYEEVYGYQTLGLSANIGFRYSL